MCVGGVGVGGRGACTCTHVCILYVCFFSCTENHSMKQSWLFLVCKYLWGGEGKGVDVRGRYFLSCTKTKTEHKTLAYF